MSRDDVIRMAKKAGFVCDEADFVFQKPGRVGIQLELERFANLVRADEREALQAEVLEQCRIIAMGAEREDALRAELTRLKASIALDKKAENARELGLDYEPAVQEPYKGLSEHLSQASGGMVRIDPVTGNVGIGTPAAQPAPVQQPVEVDQDTMELAESVGLIGPASRTHDLHCAIQRFHDLICVNATIKAAQMATDAIREATPPAALAQSAERNKLAAWMQAQGYATGHGDTIEQLLEELRWQVEERGQDAP